MGKAAKLQGKAITLGLPEMGVGGAHSVAMKGLKEPGAKEPWREQADSESCGTD